MEQTAAGIVVASLPHGEHGAVVRVLTADNGLVAAFVPGGRSRAQRPVLAAGNGVALRWRARSGGLLATAAVELIRARTLLATVRATATAVDYLTALVATVVEPGDAHPRLYAALDGVLDAMVFATTPADWLPGIVRFELLLLAELGFGLDLGTCAATGATTDLAFVSPKSSQAVGRGAGAPHASRLLPLPAFLLADAPVGPADVADGLRTTGWFLARDVLVGRGAGLIAARARVVSLASSPLYGRGAGD